MNWNNTWGLTQALIVTCIYWGEFNQLREIIIRDIISSIQANSAAGNITYADAAKLAELANTLYDQILLHYQNRGGDQTMGVMLPGAIELPHDDIIFKLERLEELESKIPALTDKIATLTGENSALADENSALADENATLTGENFALTNENATLTGENSALADENVRLKTRLAELEGKTGR